jgi:hypothetical protein
VAVYFFRYPEGLPNRKFKIRGPEGERFGLIGETLLANRLCVIPPNIHPITDQPYRWLGTPLHEVDFADLPILEI